MSLLSEAAHSEYRAFLLGFKNKEGQIQREIASTLDPDQYRGIFGVPKDQRIVYTKTWMCWGRTDQTPICPPPPDSPLPNSPPPSDQNPAPKP